MSQGYINTVLADNPYAFFAMDDAATPWKDLSGNGRNAAIVNPGQVTFRQPGLVGPDTKTALITSPGASGNSYASVATAYTSATNWSVECWFQMSSTATTQQAAIAYAGNSASNGFGIFISQRFNGGFSGNLAIQGFYGGVAFWSPSGGLDVVANTRYHVVVCRGTAAGLLYVNGLLVDTFNSASPAAPNGTLYIGNNDVTSLFNGLMQYTAFYTQQLSATQVAKHYAEGLRSGVTY